MVVEEIWCFSKFVAGRNRCLANFCDPRAKAARVHENTLYPSPSSINAGPPMGKMGKMGGGGGHDH